MTSSDPMLGTRIGDYTVEERIGAGGMGIVYRAVQPLIGKQVAIKILSPQMASHPQVMHRLLAEARMVSGIEHSGIIDIFGFGELPDGRQYIIMEYLRGTPLDTYLTTHPKLEPAEAFTILEQILSALGAAHSAGVIHRDLKPSNVFLVRQQDGTRYIKLLDFGIAKTEVRLKDTPPTAMGLLLGTPEYMAPEQVRGEQVSPRTDLYALGVLAFRMLTGEMPFSGDPVQVLLAQVSNPPPVPSKLVPGLRPEVDELIRWLLEKSPEDCPASAEQVRQAMVRLRKSWEESPTPAPATVSLKLPPSPPSPKRMLRRWVGAAGLLLAAVVGFSSLWLHQRHRPAPAPAPLPVKTEPGPTRTTEPLPPIESRTDNGEPPNVPPPTPDQPPTKPSGPAPPPTPRKQPRQPRRTPVTPIPSVSMPGASQLAQYEELKSAYEERIKAGQKRDPAAEEELKYARDLAVDASKMRDPKKAGELVQDSQRLLDSWSRKYLQ